MNKDLRLFDLIIILILLFLISKKYFLEKMSETVTELTEEEKKEKRNILALKNLSSLKDGFITGTGSNGKKNINLPFNVRTKYLNFSNDGIVDKIKTSELKIYVKHGNDHKGFKRNSRNQLVTKNDTWIYNGVPYNVSWNLYYPNVKLIYTITAANARYFKGLIFKPANSSIKHIDSGASTWEK